MAQEKLGDYVMASKSMEKALKIVPNDSSVTRALMEVCVKTFLLSKLKSNIFIFIAEQKYSQTRTRREGSLPKDAGIAS